MQFSTGTSFELSSNFSSVTSKTKDIHHTHYSNTHGILVRGIHSAVFALLFCASAVVMFLTVSKICPTPNSIPHSGYVPAFIALAATCVFGFHLLLSIQSIFQKTSTTIYHDNHVNDDANKNNDDDDDDDNDNFDTLCQPCIRSKKPTYTLISDEQALSRIESSLFHLALGIVCEVPLHGWVAIGIGENRPFALAVVMISYLFVVLVRYYFSPSSTNESMEGRSSNIPKRFACTSRIWQSVCLALNEIILLCLILTGSNSHVFGKDTVSFLRGLGVLLVFILDWCIAFEHASYLYCSFIQDRLGGIQMMMIARKRAIYTFLLLIIGLWFFWAIGYHDHHDSAHC